jgi:Domain of unknown function (DUF4258)
MPIERFEWTHHAEVRLGERHLTREGVERAIRDGHDQRQVNAGDADWRVHGVRSDGKTFAVVYDHPAKLDPHTARIVSAWPLRREKGT